MAEPKRLAPKEPGVFSKWKETCKEKWKHVRLPSIRVPKLQFSSGPKTRTRRRRVSGSPLRSAVSLPLMLLYHEVLLRLFDGGYVPVLSGLLYPYLLLPIGAFCSGLSLGRRRGFCPLYPAACVLGVLLFIPLARLFSNMYDWPLVTIALAASLAGNLAGSALHRVRKGGAGAPQ